MGGVLGSQWGCGSGRTIDDDINRKQSAKVERIGKSYVHWVGEGQRHCAHAESHLRVVCDHIGEVFHIVSIINYGLSSSSAV